MSQSSRPIIVAVDASPSSIAACEAAAAFAAARDASLIGIFVEDIELLQTAQIPTIREIGSFSASVRALDPSDLEDQLRARATQAKRALEKVARGARVAWSFRVVRGSVSSQLVSAAAEADIITLGKVGWSLAGRGHVGSTARALLARARSWVLILQPGQGRPGPVRALLEASTPLDDIVDAAAALADQAGADIELVSFAPNADAARGLAGRAKERLAALHLEARARWLGPTDGDALARAVSESAGALVVAADSDAFRPELLNEMTCPVLVVR
jgi:nucleotide-binding universal stress UspA family protein